MPRSRVLYTLLLTLALLLIRAPVGAGARAVDVVVDGKTPADYVAAQQAILPLVAKAGEPDQEVSEKDRKSADEKKPSTSAQTKDKKKIGKKPESPASEAKPGELSAVVINGVTVPKDKISSLERAYGVPIQPGRYWYDKMSGVWGIDGGPLMGQIVPNLDLGGPLKAKASNGDTGVFINGRELPAPEVMFLRQLGPVLPGRYWLNAQGIGGFEGGPPQFDLGALIAAQNKKKGGGMYGGWSRSTPGGHVGGDDNCSYFFDPNSGSSVMNCK